jgi:ArsR family transcriptional regulator, arsenate/arsenite/antimonite-responsive transcriptional repressor / arsenate reductase (thioredoxin)
MRAAQSVLKPLDFLKLLAHRIRWQILLGLSKSDYRVEELVNQVKEPPNLISYHLKQLRLRQIVTERRSTADSRDIYYSLNLEQFRQFYLQVGHSLHPALRQPIEPSQPQTKPKRSRPTRILFLCTHNSARSQMAESLLRRLGGGDVEVFSAGSEPTSIHPLTIKVMSDIGIDLSENRSKHLSEFVGQTFDYVVTVCDRVREVCPVFAADPEQIHWSIPDPAAIAGTLRARERAFANTAKELTIRIQFFLLVVKQDREDKK